MDIAKLEFLIGALVTILGGFGIQWLLARTKVKELELKRANERDEHDQALREEMANRLKVLDDRLACQDERIDQLMKELDDWKGRYYTLHEENVKLRAQVTELEQEKERQQGEINALKDKLASLQKGKKG